MCPESIQGRKTMASAESSKVSIYAALGANVAIGIAKFVGAAISGSSAMLSEGVHSVVDSVNELLLLYGIRQSDIAADDQFPPGTQPGTLLLVADGGRVDFCPGGWIFHLRGH